MINRLTSFLNRALPSPVKGLMRQLAYLWLDLYARWQGPRAQTIGIA